jgi:hypothetical protein
MKQVPKTKRFKVGDRVTINDRLFGTVRHTRYDCPSSHVVVTWDNGYEGSHGPTSGLRRVKA